jgi:hypothetical protein
MHVIPTGLDTEVERRRALLTNAARPRRPSLRRRVGWSVVRLGLVVAGPARVEVRRELGLASARS